MQLRTPPHSHEAESSLIGCLLLDNNTYDLVAGIVSAGDFYQSEHKAIFTAISTLINAGKPADVITAAERLSDVPEVDIGFLNDLAQYVPSASNIKRYAELVREKSILRSLIQAGDEIAVAGFEAKKPVQEVLDDAEQKILSIGETTKREGFKGIESLVVDFLDKIQELADSGREIVGTPTGFYDIDRMTSGMHPGDLIVVAGRPAMGKALSLESKLLTPSGWIRMGDVKVGDLLIGRDGMPYPVLGVYPQGEKQMFRVCFDDGASVLCCDEHLWLTSSRPDRKAGKPPSVRTLLEIRNTLRVNGVDNRLSHQIPWVEPMDFVSNKTLPIDPYLLGLWLGDGSISNTVKFHNPEQDLIKRFADLLPHSDELSGSGMEKRVKRRVKNNSSSDMHSLLCSIGLKGTKSESKFIPDDYLWSTAKNRLALLRGLVDTDGYVYGTGVEYCTVSKDLADGVVFLVRSLGGRVTVATKKTSFTYKGEKRTGQLAYILKFAFDSDIVPVSSKKHLSKYKGVTRKTWRYISDVVPAGLMQAQCITVGAPDRLFVTDDFVVTHNSSFAINIAEHVAIKEKLPVAVFSMEMGAAQLAVRIIGSIGRVDQGHLRTGKLTEEEWPRLTEAVEKLRGVRLHIDENGGMTAAELRAASRRLARQTGKLGLIVVDYLQLMSGADKENRATELGEISRGLKLLAKELQCPVIALSQLNRSVESRADKRPLMSDLRESGAIEQDADVIMFLYRDEYYTKEACKEPGIAEVIIAKQRSGPTGTVKMAFLNNLTRFESLSRAPLPGEKKPTFHDDY